jgi:hypothetical protein
MLQRLNYVLCQVNLCQLYVSICDMMLDNVLLQWLTRVVLPEDNRVGTMELNASQ